MSSSMSAMEPPRSTTRVSSVQVGLSAAISDELMLRLSEGTVPTANRSVTGPDSASDFLRILQDNFRKCELVASVPRRRPTLVLGVLEALRLAFPQPSIGI